MEDREPKSLRGPYHLKIPKEDLANIVEQFRQKYSVACSACGAQVYVSQEKRKEWELPLSVLLVQEDQHTESSP